VSFPGHPFFLYLEAESLIKLREYEKFDQIESVLVEFYKEGPKNQRFECYDKYLYLNALRSFQEKKYDLAIKFSSEVIDNYDTEFKWVLGYAHLIRGKSLELTGNRSIAITDYRYAVRYLDNYPDKDDAQALILSSIFEISGNK
jgi:tetratricopeptide (TPR) repeat protein